MASPSPPLIDRDLAWGKAIRPAAVTIAALMFLFVGTAWPEFHVMRDRIGAGGLALIVVCVLGRTWCALYADPRKATAMAVSGPYSVTRNPRALFAILGAVGVGAQLGSLVLAAATGVIAGTAVLLLAREHEVRLVNVHGDSYRAYAERVPRFLPRLSRWQSGEPPCAPRDLLALALRDACLFLAGVAAAEFCVSMQSAGLLPVLLRVP
jgi:protein-S-isoprenylcysteine O-methyltransferase Ste14